MRCAIELSELSGLSPCLLSLALSARGSALAQAAVRSTRSSTAPPQLARVALAPFLHLSHAGATLTAFREGTRLLWCSLLVADRTPCWCVLCFASLLLCFPRGPVYPAQGRAPHRARTAASGDDKAEVLLSITGALAQTSRGRVASKVVETCEDLQQN